MEYYCLEINMAFKKRNKSIAKLEEELESGEEIKKIKDEVKEARLEGNLCENYKYSVAREKLYKYKTEIEKKINSEKFIIECYQKLNYGLLINPIYIENKDNLLKLIDCLKEDKLFGVIKKELIIFKKEYKKYRGLYKKSCKMFLSKKFKKIVKKYYDLDFSKENTFRIYKFGEKLEKILDKLLEKYRCKNYLIECVDEAKIKTKDVDELITNTKYWLLKLLNISYRSFIYYKVSDIYYEKLDKENYADGLYELLNLKE